MRSIVTGWYKETGSDVPEPAWLQDSKEEMIQKPAKVPVSHQLTSPEVEEISPAQETLPARVEPTQQDNGISKSATEDAQISPESSQQTLPTHNNEAKKDIVE
jgi:hypothetical protein